MKILDILFGSEDESGESDESEPCDHDYEVMDTTRAGMDIDREQNLLSVYEKEYSKCSECGQRDLEVVPMKKYELQPLED